MKVRDSIHGGIPPWTNDEISRRSVKLKLDSKHWIRAIYKFLLIAIGVRIHTGCPAWIKPRTFEANRALSEGGPQGETRADKSLTPSCRAGDRVYRRQFAPFASTAMDANY